MNQTDKDTPKVIAPPPLIFLGGLLIGILLKVFWPISVLPDTLQLPFGLILISIALMIFGLSIREFVKAQTEVNPYKPTTSIISTGPYRFSRNPLYLALTLIYLGIGSWLDNIWILLLLVPILTIMQVGVIYREERYLENKFGEDYLNYKNKTRRWL